jgi:glucose-6-phosphate 1-dehydrogenase
MSQPAGKLLLFGATGDLSQRMLLPSLYGLHADGLLPQGLTITGTARSDHDDAGFREFAREALEKFLPADRKDDSAVGGFLERLFYQPLDASKTDGFAALAEKLGDISGGLAIFLSTAPSLFGPTIKGLESAGLTGANVRIGLEKPLGFDLPRAAWSTTSSPRLPRGPHVPDRSLSRQGDGAEHPGAALRQFAVRAGVERAGHRARPDHRLGDGGAGRTRIGYFDDVGALRDMVQNHMLQLLALIAMEPPARFDGTAIRDEKVKVLRSLRPIKGPDVPALTVTGQYSGGAVKGEIVRSSTELEKASDTETFVAIKAHVDNWRWQGVPFYLRTGKRLAERRSEIVITVQAGAAFDLRRARRGAEAQHAGNPPAARGIYPAAGDGQAARARPRRDPAAEVPLNLSLEHEFAGTRRRIAYERLLLDLIEGDPTLFVRRDEVEAQWEWIDAIRDGWGQRHEAQALCLGHLGPFRSPSR